MDSTYSVFFFAPIVQQSGSHWPLVQPLTHTHTPVSALTKYLCCTWNSLWRLRALYCRRVFTAITKSHPQRYDVFKSDLDKCLPSIQEIQCAFVKVRQICVVGELVCKVLSPTPPCFQPSCWNLTSFLFWLFADPFEESEERWFSSVESSRWLEYVR